MTRLLSLFNRFFSRSGVRRFKPVDSLGDSARIAALAEARLLYARHAVDVRPLAPGEEPTEPRPAALAPDTADKAP